MTTEERKVVTEIHDELVAFTLLISQRLSGDEFGCLASINRALSGLLTQQSRLCPEEVK